MFLQKIYNALVLCYSSLFFFLLFSQRTMCLRSSHIAVWRCHPGPLKCCVITMLHIYHTLPLRISQWEILRCFPTLYRRYQHCPAHAHTCRPMDLCENCLRYRTWSRTAGSGGVCIFNETQWCQSLSSTSSQPVPPASHAESPTFPYPCLHVALCSFLIFACLTDILYFFVLFIFIHLTA